jgi:hypothetical protein
MSLEMCPCCKGMKQLQGLGAMAMVDCKNCSGVGKVAKAKVEEIKEEGKSDGKKKG